MKTKSQNVKLEVEFTHIFKAATELKVFKLNHLDIFYSADRKKISKTKYTFYLHRLHLHIPIYQLHVHNDNYHLKVKSLFLSLLRTAMHQIQSIYQTLSHNCDSRHQGIKAQVTQQREELSVPRGARSNTREEDGSRHRCSGLVLSRVLCR